MPRDGFWPQWYSLEQEEVPTLMELLFYWEIETNKQEVICNSKRWRKESQSVANESDMGAPHIKKDNKEGLSAEPVLEY